MTEFQIQGLKESSGFVEWRVSHLEFKKRESLNCMVSKKVVYIFAFGCCNNSASASSWSEV